MRIGLYALLAFVMTFGFVREYFQTHTEYQSRALNTSEFTQNSTEAIIDFIYRATVGIECCTAPGVAFTGTGCVIGYNEAIDTNYIITAGHVLKEDYPLIVNYWTGHEVRSVLALEIARSVETNTPNGDIALLVVRGIGRLPAFKLAKDIALNQNEVLIGGFDKNEPPACITVGAIIERELFDINVFGWAKRGFSGGPIILRSTNELVGIVSRGSISVTACSDYTTIRKMLDKHNIQVD